MNEQPGKDLCLSVRDLSVAFRSGGRETLAVDRVSFDIVKGECLALVGESGSGKSVTALSILRLLPYPAARHPSGSISFHGRDLLQLSERDMQRVRGDEITIVFQEPMTSLNPLHTIEKQIGEILLLHRGLTGAPARARTLEVLSQVGIRDPESRLKSYPHQLSGGQRQRVMIAMALANEPDLLIADEPTTALDVTVQAQILDLIWDLQREYQSAVIIITHDLGVVAELSDDILVMYAGRMAEYGSAEDIFDDPGHPYTWGLLASMPRIDEARLDRLIPIKGTPPSLINVPSGCAFHPRCRYAGFTDGRSQAEVPALRQVSPGHLVACHLTGDQRRTFRTELVREETEASAARMTQGEQ
jgi:peptide/nickel transport system ATP-binding protein